MLFTKNMLDNKLLYGIVGDFFVDLETTKYIYI